MPKENISFILIILSIVAIIIIVAVVILFGIFVNRKNKLIQDQLEKELNHQQKLHNIELNALRSQLNPHFVHNSLNAIQYYIQQNDVETSENYLTKFSKLMRLFFDYSRKQKITLTQEITLLKNYLQIEKLRFEEKLNYQFIIDKNLDIEEEEIPSMMLQPIVENAINHGIFHKRGGGLITLEFQKTDKNSYTVIITDDGIGINKASKINKTISNNKTTHSGTVLEERLMLLKESENWDIDYTINDRSANKKQTGTEVKLIFKQLF